MNKRTAAGWVKKIESERAKVSKARDSLRDTLDELESLKGSCDEAIECLDSAIVALSEYA
jgi:hypothetical protein